MIAAVRRSEEGACENAVFTKNLLMAMVFVAIFLPTYIWLRPGVAVVIRNSNSTTLRDLRVYVSSGTHKLGNVSSGEIGSCVVLAKGMSSIEISYRLTDGTERQQYSNIFFDSDSLGPIDLGVTNDGLVDALD